MPTVWTVISGLVLVEESRGVEVSGVKCYDGRWTPIVDIV